MLDLDNLLARVRSASRHPTSTSRSARRRTCASTATCSPWDCDEVTPADTERIAFALMPKARADEFLDHHEADFAYTLAGLGRFRVNVFRQRGSVGLVLRRVLPGIPSMEDLGLPPIVPPPRRGAARARARHRPDRLGQDDDARRDDRPHQRAPGASHRDDRGPDRGAAPGQAVDREPARDRHRHRRLPQRAQARAAPGPRRDPHRRDARPRDGVGRARRPRRPGTSSSRRCTRWARSRRSRASSTSSRRSSSSRCGCRWRRRCRGIISQRLLERADRDGPGPGDGGARRHRPGLRQDRRRRRRPTSSRRSSPTASSTGCRPSTRACATSTSRAS